MVPTGECPHDSIHAEIQQILIDHPRTRYAKVLLGMLRGLTDAEMAKEAAEAGEPISADSIAMVRRLVRLSLDDKLVPAPSDAEGQAGLYRELLNYRRSPELTQHIKTKLAKRSRAPAAGSQRDVACRQAGRRRRKTRSFALPRPYDRLFRKSLPFLLNSRDRHGR